MWLSVLRLRQQIFFQNGLTVLQLQDIHQKQRAGA
jgi:hypothetical protein